jgi:hypothetical protein
MHSEMMRPDPLQAEAAFREAATKFGLNYDDMCVSDNTACTE